MSALLLAAIERPLTLFGGMSQFAFALDTQHSNFQVGFNISGPVGYPLYQSVTSLNQAVDAQHGFTDRLTAELGFQAGECIGFDGCLVSATGVNLGAHDSLFRSDVVEITPRLGASWSRADNSSFQALIG